MNLEKILLIPRLYKQLIIFFADFLISLFSVYGAFCLKFESIFIPDLNSGILILILSIIFLPIFIFFGFYSNFFRFIKVKIIGEYLISSFFLILIQTTLLLLARFSSLDFIFGVPITVGVFSSTIFILCIIILRLAIIFVIDFKKEDKVKIIVVGSINKIKRLLNFIDNNTNYYLQKIIDPKKNLNKLLDEISNINIIIFDSKEDFEKVNKSVINKLLSKNTSFKISNQNFSKFNLDDIGLEDLIERGINYYDCESLREVEKKNILITGGAGSIGSILFLKLLEFRPNKIVILDNSEINIYNLKKKLSKSFNINKLSTKIEYKLASITNDKYLNKLFKENKFSYVYNVAAFKHVSIVEDNFLEAFENNFFGFYNIALNSIKFNIEKVVLISTDKAVEPSNYMGLSKKYCELIVQQFAKKSKTILYAVRFGNVFESSGSVIPLFKEQILNNEELTVTDKKVTRYFMSIKEAVNLILETQEIAESGKVYLFDMGNPVKILDIAKKLAILAGKKIYFDKKQKKK